MADVGELLDAELGREAILDVEGPPTIEYFLSAPGLPRRQALNELAEVIAGTTNRRSKAYKTALRNAERWSKGTKPSPRSQARLAAARRQSTDRLKAFRARGAWMRLRVSWYATRTPEWLPPGRWLAISRDETRLAIRLWAEGEHFEAGQTMLVAFLQAYGVPNPEEWLISAIVLDMRLEPRGEGEPGT